MAACLSCRLHSAFRSAYGCPYVVLALTNVHYKYYLLVPAMFFSEMRIRKTNRVNQTIVVQEVQELRKY